MEKAQKLLQKGKLKDTIVVLNQVIEVDPTDFRVLLKKGELESRVGDSEGAKQSYTQVAEQYSQDGFYLKAIAIYKKILKLDAEEFHIYSKLAHLYRKLGLDSEAKKHLKVVAEYYKAKGLKTHYHEVAVQLSELGETISDSQIEFVEKFAKDGDRDRAIEHFRTVSEKCLESGNLTQLDMIVKKMDELQLQDLELYTIQAKAFINGKEPKKALQVIQKAYAMQPQNTATLELLARCFLELKQPLKTASVFNELLKIYDRNGDMKNLTRVRSDLQRINDPTVKVEELSKEEIEVEQYETINREESEEFVIEEVQVFNSGPKTSAPAAETHHRLDVSERDEALEGSFSELEKDLEDSSMEEVSEVELSAATNLDENDFEREDSTNLNETSFMNVFVDAFDGSEETILSKQPSKPTVVAPSVQAPKAEPTKIDNVIPDFNSFSLALDETGMENTTLDDNSISFQSMSSFESVMKDVAEPTRIDIDESELSQPEKTIEANSGVINVEFNESAPAKPQQLIDFDQFYSDGNKEKSEISVHEEEFVSISQFIDESSKPAIPDKPEKIQIHDRVTMTRPSAPTTVPSIKQSSLENQTIAADIESTVDFSNLDVSELSLNLNMPQLENSNPSLLDEPSIDSREVMQSLLVDPEPEFDDGQALAKHIQLDEKTMLDLKHEFHESTKVDRAPAAVSDDSFFDLAGELKDEISEFEKSFGKMDEDAEEEFLSPEEVILEFKKGIARTIDKSDYQTHYNLGLAYKEMGLIDEAISAFELSSTNAESRIDSISMIGICLSDKGDFEAAVKLYHDVLRTLNYQDPKYLGLTYQLGEAYMELGRHVDAYKAFAKVRDIDASYRDVKSRVKELQFNLGIKDQDHSQQSGRIIVDMKDRKKNKL
jgi:tetratricopeptide (TPR) repeat protein